MGLKTTTENLNTFSCQFCANVHRTSSPNVTSCFWFILQTELSVNILKNLTLSFPKLKSKLKSYVLRHSEMQSFDQSSH